MKLASRTGAGTLELSIVIVSFDSRQVLANCLQSALSSCAESPFSHEIIVVDNASSDGSPTLVRTQFPNVNLVEEAENRGYAAAVNSGITHSNGRYICILNADTELQQGALQVMLRFMESHPSAAVAGPQLLNVDGSLQDSAFRFPTLAMSFLDFFPVNYRLTRSRLNGRYPRSGSHESFEIDHPLGACMIIRRDATEGCGLMDESYFMYCEEVDWCLRFKRGGWGVYCVPDATVVHMGGESTSQRPAEMFYALHRARYMFFRKHYSHAFAVAAAAITRIGVLRELVRLYTGARRMSLTHEQKEQLKKAYIRVLRMPVGALNA